MQPNDCGLAPYRIPDVCFPESGRASRGGRSSANIMNKLASDQTGELCQACESIDSPLVTVCVDEDKGDEARDERPRTVGSN